MLFAEIEKFADDEKSLYREKAIAEALFFAEIGYRTSDIRFVSDNSDAICPNSFAHIVCDLSELAFLLALAQIGYRLSELGRLSPTGKVMRIFSHE